MRFYQGCLNSLLFLALVVVPASGHAGWLFADDTASGRTGLDLNQGYDRNTVVTLTGRVAARPVTELGPLTMELLVGNERLSVVLGPSWYFQNDSLDWKVDDVVTVRGSRAQGKDGRNYLIAQWISLPNGDQMAVRSTAGRPLWSGGQRLQNRQGGGLVQGGGGRKGR